MHLRNGKITTAPLATPSIVIIAPAPTPVGPVKHIPTFEKERTDTVVAKFKLALSTPNVTIMDSMTLYENVFTVFNENFEVIIQPGFNPSGRFLNTVRERIAHWHAVIAQKFLDNLIETPKIATEACAKVKKTQEIIACTEKLLATISA
jgi:hypothetical protein